MLNQYDLKMETVLLSEATGQLTRPDYAIKVTHLPTKLFVQLPVVISSTITMREAMSQLETLVRNANNKKDLEKKG